MTNKGTVTNVSSTTTSTSTVATIDTTSGSTVATIDTTSGSTVTTIDTTSGSTTGSTQSVNVTTSAAPYLPNTMGSGAAVGISIGVVLLFLACVLVVYYLRKTGRLKCLTVRGRPRRSSTSSSRHPLEPDESEAGDTLPRLTDGDMFAIADQDDYDDRDAGGATEDSYFYDEVFGSSAFEDETTKASNKDLFSEADTDSIPDLLLRVDRITFN